MIDSGARQLVAVFSRWAKETSPAMDAGSLYDKGKPFPALSAFFLEHAIPLIAYLRALPEIGSKIAKEAEKAYGEVRATYIEDSVKQAAKDVLIDATPTLSASPDRRGLGRFLDVLFALCKYEHALLGTVFTGVPPTVRRDVYAVILPPSLGLLFTTGSQLNTLVKKNLHALVTIAFGSFTELQERSGEFEEWVRTKANRKDNELGELLHALRGTCLTSLPGFIDDTRTWGTKQSAASEGAGVNAVTVNVVSFMRQLSDNQATVEALLAVLGAGNWGGPPTTSHAIDEDAGLLTRYLNDVLITLLNALDARARIAKARSTGVASIFLLNNISYIRREVLSSQIGDLLGEACEDSLNKRMRSAKSAYLENWSPLVSALLDAGLDQGGAAGAIKAGLGAVKGGGLAGASEKRETKDRFVRFHDAFEEVEELHRGSRLDEGEQELRERLKGEVERMVVPTYSKFLARHRGGEFSKSKLAIEGGS